MVRTFNSVGQGAFYTEEFLDSKFTMVYDCGSYKDKSIIEDEIKKCDLKDEIDLLVISHFHEDHINGLEYLLRNYKIKNILLPFLPLMAKIEAFLYNRNATSFIQNLSLYPVETIGELQQENDVNIIFVNEHNDEVNNEPINIDDLSTPIKSGTKIAVTTQSECRDWIYVPFNFKFQDRSVKLKKIFKCRKIPTTLDEFISFYKDNENIVIDAYKCKKMTGDMNTNSLVLYSGVDCKNSHHYYSRCSFPYCRPYRFHDEVGCLYMGDYNVKGGYKRKEFEFAFERYFNCVGIIQIPHHGSRHNYHERLNFKPNLVSVISAGINNQFRHPHASTVKKIVLKGGIPVIVSESPASRFIQKIWCDS